jgi:hypothetical protein
MFAQFTFFFFVATIPLPAFLMQLWFLLRDES